MRPPRGGRIDKAVKAKNRTKSQVRAKVEHAIGVINATCVVDAAEKWRISG